MLDQKMHKRTKSRGDWIEKEAFQVTFYQMSHFVRFDCFLFFSLFLLQFNSVITDDVLSYVFLPFFPSFDRLRLCF